LDVIGRPELGFKRRGKGLVNLGLIRSGLNRRVGGELAFILFIGSRRKKGLKKLRVKPLVISLKRGV